MREKFFIPVLLVLSLTALFGQSGWDNFVGTDSAYSRKLISLNLTANFINVENQTLKKNPDVLVFLSDSPKNNIYFKVLCEVFCKDVSLLEYVTNRTHYINKSRYSKDNLRYYLRNRILANPWPPVFWEPKEIEREIEKKGYSKKHLLITGLQSSFLTNSDIQNTYDSLIIVSPDISLLSLNDNVFNTRKLLWVGGNSELNKLTMLKNKFGGDLLTYSKSSIGKTLLMKNLKALNDILTWIKNET